jgi:hypothetical protein
MYLGTLSALDLATAQADVTAAFQSLFGRTPAASGLSFYANKLVAGSLTPAGLNAALLANASAADLAYYNAHSGATPSPTPSPSATPTQTPAPQSVPGATAAENTAVNAAINANAYLLTPGVNDYAAMEKTVYIDVGESGGVLSVPQTWVAITGHTDQYWQEVQAAYEAGKNPGPTTYQDTWLSSVPSGAVQVGSAAAMANMKQVISDYLSFLRNQGWSNAAITNKLASFGVDINGNPLAGGATTTPTPTPTPTPAPTGTIYQSPTPTPTPTPTPASYSAPTPAPTPTQTPTPASYSAPPPQNQAATIPTASNIVATASPTVLPTTAPAGSTSYASGGGSTYSAPAPTSTAAASTAGTMSISPLALAIGAAGLLLIANRKK